MTNNSNFTDDFLNETRHHKNLQTMGDVVGLPDAEDKERIRRYLIKYEDKHPGEIQFHTNLARAQFRDAGGVKQKYGLVNKQASGRTLFELPVELGQWFENAYPLMFRDKKHLAWFCKHFPELLIPEKY